MKNKKKTPLGTRIIEALSSYGSEKLNYKQIAAKVGVFDKAGRIEVQKQIAHFLEAQILLSAGRGKYRLNPKYISKETTGRNVIVGEIQFNRSGNAFVVNEEQEEDVFISEQNLGMALHRDKVKVMLFPLRKNKKPEGQVIEIIKRSTALIVGTIQFQKGIAFVVPDNNFYRREIIIPSRMLNQAKEGDKVVFRIVEWKEGTRNPIAEVVYLLGKPGENEVEMNAILAQFGFPLSFSHEVEEECARIQETISKEEILKRRDFRDAYTFTIDPADAKDFDDAISFEEKANGDVRIGVHIADVSHYVRRGSAIDKEAYLRGTSVYLVDRTIPMLPEKLSNNLCSLRPHEDKLCFSAIFEMDSNAKIKSEWFGKTVIHSDARYSYEEVQEMIETGKGEGSEPILKVNAIAQKLRKKRFDQHAINFETEEVRFVLDENSKPIAVQLKVQKEANFLIEELMLLANKRVAERIGKKTAKNKEPKTFVYRIHDEPIHDKLENFKSFVQKLGFDFQDGSRKKLTQSLNQMFQIAKEKNQYNMLTQLSVRMMARAVYSTDNIGHYGLAFPYYSHFTSPIRRYPDLMVHRLFQAYLDEAPSVAAAEYEEYCKHCSKMEQKAVDAERASIKFKQAEYMLDKIGETFDAVVSGLAKWGVFAELKDSKCEGLIPMKEFTDDFYYLDQDSYTLIGLHNGRNIQFGDQIKVKVVEVDLLKKSLTFSLVR
ncbi:MAG TPA: ribonuclease R [Bacteroidales bacterium]|nr:ribonuclease R [Bacteroidales bacterium]